MDHEEGKLVVKKRRNRKSAKQTSPASAEQEQITSKRRGPSGRVARDKKTVRSELHLIRQQRDPLTDRNQITVIPIAMPGPSSSISTGVKMDDGVKPTKGTLPSVSIFPVKVTPGACVEPSVTDESSRGTSPDKTSTASTEVILPVPPPAHSTPFKYGYGEKEPIPSGKQPEPAHKISKGPLYTHQVLPQPYCGLQSPAPLVEEGNPQPVDPHPQLVNWYYLRFMQWHHHQQAVNALMQIHHHNQVNAMMNGFPAMHMHCSNNNVNPNSQPVSNLYAPPSRDSIVASQLYQEALKRAQEGQSPE